MKNKSFVMIVCLVLMVFSFTAAVAADTETVTTITVKPGSLMAELTDVNQICDIAAIRIHSLPAGYGAFVLSLNNVDALQALFRVTEEGAYVQSAALGSAPLYFGWKDLTELLKKQMQANPNMLPMNGMFSNEMMQSMMDGSMTEEQAMGMMGIDQELMTYMNDIAAKQTVETGSFTVEGSDAADQKAVTIVTEEDMIRAIDLPIVRKQIASQMVMSSPTMTEAEINAQIDAQLAEIKREIAAGNPTATVAMYTANGEFVAFQMTALAQPDTSAGTSGGMTVTVTRTTVGTAKFYQLSVRLINGDQQILNQYGSLYLGDDFTTGKYSINDIDGSPVFAAEFGCDRTVPDHTSGQFAVTVYDSYNKSQNAVFVVFDQAKAANVTDTAVSVFTGSSVDAIKAAMAKTDLISFNFHTVTQPDSGFFAALQNATPETSVQPATMTDEELNAFMMGLQQNLMMTVFTVIDNLPPSISDALMQQMGGGSF